MTPINGKDVVVYINKDGDDIPVFCATDCTFSEEKEAIEASTETSGIWKEWRLRKRSWLLDVTGITKINNDDGQESYFDLLLSGVAMEAQGLTISFTDDDGNTVSIQGTAYIQKSSITGPATDFANASASFLGTGAYTITTDSSSSGGGGGECDPIGVSDFDFPDAVVGEDYDFTIPLTGDPPFARGGGIPTKPSWMIIDSSGANLSGSPEIGDVGVGSTVHYFIENCDGANQVEINKTINVGKNVFVINNFIGPIVLQNSAGESYTFGASNADDGNIIMTSDTINLITVNGTIGFDGADYEFLQDLLPTVINSGSCVGGDDIVTDDLSTTNYLRFSGG